MSADRWKLNLSVQDQCELYDLNADPYENLNLFDEPEQRGRVQDMADRIRVWQTQTGDRTPLPEI